jgi:hypothetical protein
VVFDGFFDQGQAHATAFGLVAGLEGLKHLKDLRVIRQGNAGAVIGHEHLDRVAQIAPGDFQAAIGAIMVFERIANEVA